MSQSQTQTHPCLSCGACCAFFRVLFDVSELTDPQYSPPSEYVVSVDSQTRAMMGTLGERTRCVALSGKVGSHVQCSIYENRPSCCRSFRASYESGERNRRCDKARQAKGLKPLSLEDWNQPRREVDPMMNNEH